MKPDTVANNSAILSSDRDTSLPVRKEPSVAYRELRPRFIAVVLAQVVLMAGFGAQKAYTLAFGTDITLKAHPVDPYDMFRGEYAALAFDDMSSCYVGDGPFQYGEQAFVLLQRRGDHWATVFASKHRPTAGPGQVVALGTVKTYGEKSKGMFVDVDFGIGRLYMPEGRSAQMQSGSKTIYATVAVDSFGHTCIKDVTVNGHQVYNGTSSLNPFN